MVLGTWLLMHLFAAQVTASEQALNLHRPDFAEQILNRSTQIMGAINALYLADKRRNSEEMSRSAHLGAKASAHGYRDQTASSEDYSSE